MMKFLKDTGFIPLAILALAAISFAFVPTFTPTKLLTSYEETNQSIPYVDDGCASQSCVFDGALDYLGSSAETTERQLVEQDFRLITTASELANWEGTGAVDLYVNSTATASITISNSTAASNSGEVRYSAIIDYYDSSDPSTIAETHSGTSGWVTPGTQWDFDPDQYDGTLAKVGVTLNLDTRYTFAIERTAATCGTSSGTSTTDTWANLYRN